MHYAIIAAGDGSRLAAEGISKPKPLVSVCGIPMIERLLLIFSRHNAESISVIVNTNMTEVQAFLQQWSLPQNLKKHHVGKFNLVVQSTPSSMHSFYCLSKVIKAKKICLTTVDTIFVEDDFCAFIDRAETTDNLFALTSFIDDEKPLYVDVCNSHIKGFYDTGSYELVSGGIYCLNTEKAFPVLEKCLANGVSRMRNYQRALLEDGLDIEAWVFPKIMDVDHAQDILKAEQFISSSIKNVLLIKRAEVFSPNNVESDRHILELVAGHLSATYNVQTIAEEDFMQNASRAYEADLCAVAGMMRMPRSLDKIDKLGIKAFNSVVGIANAQSRSRSWQLLHDAGIPVPAKIKNADVLLQNKQDKEKTDCSLWVKASRPDGVGQNDVVFAKSKAEAARKLVEFNAESLSDVTVTEHVEGDLLKVYAVLDHKYELQFLHSFYPQDHGYTKFGNEQHNTQPVHYAYCREQLEVLVQKVAQAFDLQFFGLDIVVRQSGEFVVIDVNDWPSYSICQEDAAEAIARTILIDIEACRY